MSPLKPSPMPLPAAALALSVAVCLGVSAQAQAAHAGPRAQAEQRETLSDLLQAIQRAAKALDQQLNDRLDSKALAGRRDAIRPVLCLNNTADHPAKAQAPPAPLLRETLLNLPPPAR